MINVCKIILLNMILTDTDALIIVENYFLLTGVVIIIIIICDIFSIEKIKISDQPYEDQ